MDYYNLLCWDTIKCNCGYGSYFVLSFWRTWKWIGMASNIMALFMLVGAVIGFLSSLHELVYGRLIKGDKSVGIMENLFSMLVYGGLAFMISCFFIRNYLM